MQDHVSTLSAAIDLVINAYLDRYEDADVNDAMSALAVLIVQMCKQYDVTRMSMIQNLAHTYEQYEEFQKERH
jgi:hypothetical protein